MPKKMSRGQEHLLGSWIEKNYEKWIKENVTYQDIASECAQVIGADVPPNASVFYNYMRDIKYDPKPLMTRRRSQERMTADIPLVICLACRQLVVISSQLGLTIPSEIVRVANMLYEAEVQSTDDDEESPPLEPQ